MLVRTLVHRDASVAVATPGRAMARTETSVQDLETIQTAIDAFLPIAEGERDYGIDYYYNASLLQNKLSDILDKERNGNVPATPASVRPNNPLLALL